MYDLPWVGLAIASGSSGKQHGLTHRTHTTAMQDRIGAAVIMCKDLENYTEQDWNVLLDKPELVFARAR